MEGAATQRAVAGDAKISPRVQLPGGFASPIVLLRERYAVKIGGWHAGINF